MKKTKAQESIRPITIIKVPGKIQHRPSREFYESIDIPVITKKQLLSGMQTVHSLKKEQQVRLYKRSSSNHSKIPSSSKKIEFRLQTSGAGFRKRAKSQSALGVNSPDPQRAADKHVSHLQSHQAPQALEILKSYYSVEGQPHKFYHQRNNSHPKVQIYSKGTVLGEKHHHQKLTEHLKHTGHPHQTKRSKAADHLKPAEHPPQMKHPRSTQYGKLFQQTKKAHELEQSEQNNYSQQLQLLEMEWVEERQRHAERGLGVNSNLSCYDLESLDDPRGLAFLQEYQNQRALCPMFFGNKYQWKEVTVNNFDPEFNRALVSNGDEEFYVSRLSLKAKNTPDKQYWSRVHQAKLYSNRAKQARKYTAYLDQRPEQYVLTDFVDPLIPIIKYTQVAKQCHNRYARQFLVYYQMQRDYSPFQKMGIFYRSLTPFQEISRPLPFQNYGKMRSQIQLRHYTRFPGMGSSLRFIIHKIQQASLSVFCFPQEPVLLREFVNFQCQLVQQAFEKFIGITRQVIIAEIIEQVGQSLGREPRTTQQQYFRIHNYLFRHRVVAHFYDENHAILSEYYQTYCCQPPCRPEPFLKLQIQASLHTKSLGTSPTEQECYQQLLLPFTQLENSVMKIPDLSADLSYTSPESIRMPSRPRMAGQVSTLLEHSFAEIRKYTSQMTRYMKYLNPVQLQAKPFEVQTLNIYDKQLNQMISDLKGILHSSLGKSGIFLVDLQPFKRVLTEAIGNHKAQMLCKIERQTIEKYTSLRKQTDLMRQELGKVPNDECELVGMRKYINTKCQVFLATRRQSHELCSRFYELLEQYSHVYNNKEFVKHLQANRDVEDLSEEVERKGKELDQLEKQFLEIINEERENIFKGIDQAKDLIQEILKMKVFEQYRKNSEVTCRTYYTLEEHKLKLKQINYREGLLKQELSVFPLLPQYIRTLHPYFSMWNSINCLMNDSSDWDEQSIPQLQYREIMTKVRSYTQQLKRLSKLFENLKNIDAVSVCDKAIEAVKAVESRMWIVQSFTKQGLVNNSQIMADVLRTVCGPLASNSLKNISLSFLLTKGAQQNQEYIQETANRAQRIWELEKSIRSIVHRIKQLHFEIGQRQGLPSISEALLQSLMAVVKECLGEIDIIGSGKQVSQISKKISKVRAKTSTIESTLQRIIVFQQSFFPAHRLFQHSQIANDLPAEKKLMEEVSSLWGRIIKHFRSDLQLWEAIDSQSYFHRLGSSLETLSQISESMGKFLRDKRKIYPRFFFLTDSELTEMIVQEEYVVPTSRIRRLLAIESLEVTHRGIEGLNGVADVLKFRSCISTVVVIWDRWKMIHESMVQAMKNHAKHAHQSQLMIYRLLTKMYEWTLEAEQSLSKGSLKPLLDRHIAQVNATKVKSGTQLRELQLLTTDIVLRDLVVSLCQKAIESVTDFEWLKMLKVYSTPHANGNRLYWKTLSYAIDLNYEFVEPDLTDHLIYFATPRASIHTILVTSLTLSMGTVLKIGRFESTVVKNIANFSMSHFVELGMDQEIGMHSFTQGFFSENSWGVLRVTDVTQNLEALSILAQAANEIRHLTFTEHVQAVPPSISSCEGFRLHILGPAHCPIEHLCQNRVIILRNSFRDCSLVTANVLAILRIVLEAVNHPDIEHFVEALQTLIQNNQHVSYSLRRLMALTAQETQLSHAYGERLMQRIHESIRPSNNSPTTENSLRLETSFEMEKSHFQEHIARLRGESDKSVGIKELIVVGPCDSGKTHLIECTLQSQKNKDYAISYNVQSHVNSAFCSEEAGVKFLILTLNCCPITQKYLYQQRQCAIDCKLGHGLTLIYETQSISELSPESLVSLPVFAKKDNIDWRMCYQIQSSNHLSSYQPLQEEAERQLHILWGSLKSNTQQQSAHNSGEETNRMFIKIAYQLVKSLLALINQSQLPLNRLSIRQTTLTVLIMVAGAYIDIQAIVKETPMLEQIESTFCGNGVKRNPELLFDYHYDVQKQAWIQWNVVHLSEFFQEQFQHFDRIFLPVKETVCALFFGKHFSKQHHVCILSRGRQRGNGCTSIAQRVAGNRNIGYYSMHRRWDGKALSQMLTQLYPCRRAEGFYCPFQNSSATIVIDDIHMANQQGEMSCKSSFSLNYITNLAKFSIDMHSGRKICGTSLVFCGRNQIGAQILKYSLPIWVREMCKQSIRLIYSYVLDWFFGSTRNPFSKEVRNVKDTLIEKSLTFTIGNPANPSDTSPPDFLLRHKLSYNLRTLRDLYSFICCLSPKIIKTSDDMLQAFQHQFSLVCLSQARSSKLFARLSDEYSPCTTQEIRDILTNRFGHCQQGHTYQTLLLWEEFIQSVVVASRLFLQSSSNLLHISPHKSGRKTVLKCAKLLATNQMGVALIHEASIEGWMGEICQFMGLLRDQQEAGRRSLQRKSVPVRHTGRTLHELMVFNVDSYSSPEYLNVVIEYMQSRESRSLLFSTMDSQSSQSLLDYVEVSSIHSAEYQQFVGYCRDHMRIAVLYSANFEKQYIKLEDYPELIQQASIIRIQTRPSIHELEGMATAGLRTIYNSFDAKLFKLSQSVVTDLVQQKQSQLDESMRRDVEKVLKVHSHIQQQMQGGHSLVTIQCKHKMVLWMKTAVKYFDIFKSKSQSTVRDIYQVLHRKEGIVRQKEALEHELRTLIPKLSQIKNKNMILREALAQQKGLEGLQRGEHDHQQALCCKQRQRTDSMKQECEAQLDKVMPLLQAAEQSLQKVTRDDINQLRSFFNPPASAAKVVQALCFVFNEDRLVKQKVVLETGERIRDYWEYAKKYILNDKLLKRVAQFKPEFIKQLGRNQVNQLRLIVKQPEFREDRVFKASSAAGNLSVWMRAVISTYEVMEIIGPKRKLLSSALQALRLEEELLAKLRQTMEAESLQTNKKQLHYDEEMGRQKQIQTRVRWLEEKTERVERFIGLLMKMQGRWKSRIRSLVQQEQVRAREQALVLAFFTVYLSQLPCLPRQRVINRMTLKDLFPDFDQASLLCNQPCFSYSRNLIFEPDLIFPLIFNDHPINPHYLQNYTSLRQGLPTVTAVLLDETQTFHQLLPLIFPNEQFVVLDCLELDTVGLYRAIYPEWEEQMQEQEREDIKRTYYILLGLEHNWDLQTALLSHRNQTPADQKTRKLLHLRYIIMVEGRQHSNLVSSACIYNELSTETLESLLEVRVSRVRRQSICEALEFEVSLRNKQISLMHTIRNSEDILLDDSKIEHWMAVYQEYEAATLIRPQISGLSKMQTQILTQLGSNRFWQSDWRIVHYLTAVEELAHNNRNAQINFQDELIAIFNKNRGKSPVTIVEAKMQAGSKSNAFKAFLSAVDGLNYIDCLDSLTVYLHSQRKILLVCSTKMEAYRLSQAITREHEQLMLQMEESDDEFQRETYAFAAYILIESETNMKVSQRWRLLRLRDLADSQSQNSSNEELRIVEHLHMSETSFSIQLYRQRNQNSAKQERAYCQSLLAQAL